MKILVKAQAGSHLFGTNTENSDMDYKGIYIPDKKDIYLGKVEDTYQIKRSKEHGEKNTKDDVDVEFYSLKKYIQMLNEGQTVALELLFTPDDKIIEADPSWYSLREYWKSIFLNKKTTAFVGYCKTQADKYGVKGSRMAAIKKAIEALELFTPKNSPDRIDFLPNTKLKNVWEELKSYLYNVDYIEFGEQETKLGMIPYMKVCESMYQDNQSWENAYKALKTKYDVYGARAQQAERNEGIDWKALSHAYRVCCQAIELLRDHKLTLPLKENDLKMVRNVKLGLVPFKEFQPLLELKLEEVIKAEEESTLNSEMKDKEFCDDFVYQYYVHFLN